MNIEIIMRYISRRIYFKLASEEETEVYLKLCNLTYAFTDMQHKVMQYKHELYGSPEEIAQSMMDIHTYVSNVPSLKESLETNFKFILDKYSQEFGDGLEAEINRLNSIDFFNTK